MNQVVGVIEILDFWIEYGIFVVCCASYEEDFERLSLSHETQYPYHCNTIQIIVQKRYFDVEQHIPLSALKLVM